MIAAIRAWRERRSCFHHDHRTGETWIGQGQIINGARKLFRCRRCSRIWIN